MEEADKGEDKQETNVGRTVLKVARSIDEIVNKIPEFEYREEDKMICVVCGESFKYSRNIPRDFSQGRISEKFSNFKTHMKDHLKSMKHQKVARDNETLQMITAKREIREKAIGQRVGRLVYYLLHNGRPDIDFPLLMYINSKNGTDVGDINHEEGFVTRLLPELAENVRNRLKKHLSSPMAATGCLPPVNIVADKVTYQH